MEKEIRETNADRARDIYMRYITLDYNGRECGFCYNTYLNHEDIMKVVNKLIEDMM
jgi:hypothetical protein